MMAPMTETPEQAFIRGTIAGAVETRLAGHDRHFAAINGSLATVADEMHQVVLGIQRLTDQAASDRQTVIATAAALRLADEARRTQTAERWSGVQKLLALWAAIATAIGLWLALKG
jgi:hypothetical protein